jgi:hypothetical protein
MIIYLKDYAVGEGINLLGKKIRYYVLKDGFTGTNYIIIGKYKFSSKYIELERTKAQLIFLEQGGVQAISFHKFVRCVSEKEINEKYPELKI